MRVKLHSVVVYAIITLCVLVSCSSGKRPFLVVHLCLGNQRNVSEFTELMKSIANSQRMEFTDGSVATQDDLRAMHSSPDYKLIYIGAKREDGVGMEAGNLGLSAYEVSIGFSDGSDSAYAHRFADMVVTALKERWHVVVVPADRGALPLKSCGQMKAAGTPRSVGTNPAEHW